MKVLLLLALASTGLATDPTAWVKIGTDKQCDENNRIFLSVRDEVTYARDETSVKRCANIAIKNPLCGEDFEVGNGYCMCYPKTNTACTIESEANEDLYRFVTYSKIAANSQCGQYTGGRVDLATGSTYSNAAAGVKACAALAQINTRCGAYFEIGSGSCWCYEKAMVSCNYFTDSGEDLYKFSTASIPPSDSVLQLQATEGESESATSFTEVVVVLLAVFAVLAIGYEAYKCRQTSSADKEYQTISTGEATALDVESVRSFNN